MSLGNDHVKGTFTAGHLAIGDVCFVKFNPVDAHLSVRARAGHMVATDADDTLDEGLFAATRNEAGELAKLTQNRGRRRL